jgi:hypothetical protein
MISLKPLDILPMHRLGILKEFVFLYRVIRVKKLSAMPSIMPCRSGR